ncbi:hypothetical protein [Georgenia faecalis]|uniref:Uncharacterized protein n=1 Tax=Georgenia faecalis TaxID=2483799 RepID=A0ABV9D825_9MICO|nr:hypothetical protein [Georgenia faecalis]
MTFLSSLLPGVRDLRTPFAVGALWVLAVTLLVYPSNEELRKFSVIESAEGVFAALPATVQISCLCFGVYLAGMLAHGLGVWLGQWLIARPVITRLNEDVGRLLGQENPRVTFLVQSAINARLRPISDVLASLVPAGFVMDEFDLASLRLNKENPEQYQQYDRVRAEGEFRLGVSMPLLAALLVVGFLLPPWPGAAVCILGFGAAIVILVQGLQHRRQADEYMASSIYFGHTSTPMFDALVESAKSELPPRPDRMPGQELAWFCDFLAARNSLDRYGEFLSKVGHPSKSRANLLGAAAPYMDKQTRRMMNQLFDLDEVSDAVARAGTDGTAGSGSKPVTVRSTDL